MSLKKHTRQFKSADGEVHDWTILEFPGEDGSSLFFKLVELGGDSVGHILDVAIKIYGQSQSGVMDADIDGVALGQALTGLAARLSLAGGPAFIKQLLVHCIRDGAKFTPGPSATQGQWCYNQAFQANYGELMKAVVAIIEVNYSNLFGGLPAKLSALMKQAMTESPVG